MGRVDGGTNGVSLNKLIGEFFNAGSVLSTVGVPNAVTQSMHTEVLFLNLEFTYTTGQEKIAEIHGSFSVFGMAVEGMFKYENGKKLFVVSIARDEARSATTDISNGAFSWEDLIKLTHEDDKILIAFADDDIIGSEVSRIGGLEFNTEDNPPVKFEAGFTGMLVLNTEAPADGEDTRSTIAEFIGDELKIKRAELSLRMSGSLFKLQVSIEADKKIWFLH